LRTLVDINIMPSGGHLTLADLPNELVILSFKFAAASSRDFCFALSFVSSWARDIALSFLLSTVVLDTAEKLHFFLEYLSKHPKYAAFVVNIWLPSHRQYCLRDLTDLTALLEACHNAVNLSVTGPLLWNSYPETFNFPHFRERGLRLFIHDHASTTSKAHSAVKLTLGLRPNMFNLVTHIHTNYDFFAERVAGIALHIARFPRLTHLAIDVVLPDLPFDIDDFKGVLNSPTLVALVLVVDHPKPHNAATIHGLYKEIRVRGAVRLNVRVAFGGSLTVWRGRRRGWLDEVEGHQRHVWERAVQDTEWWDANST
jgi:hypothetical protein